MRARATGHAVCDALLVASSRLRRAPLWLALLAVCPRWTCRRFHLVEALRHSFGQQRRDRGLYGAALGLDATRPRPISFLSCLFLLGARLRCSRKPTPWVSRSAFAKTQNSAGGCSQASGQALAPDRSLAPRRRRLRRPAPTPRDHQLKLKPQRRNPLRVPGTCPFGANTTRLSRCEAVGTTWAMPVAFDFANKWVVYALLRRDA